MPGVMRYGYGYIQGINAAAKEMGITDKVTVEYAYGDNFMAPQRLQQRWTHGIAMEQKLCLLVVEESLLLQQGQRQKLEERSLV